MVQRVRVMKVTYQASNSTSEEHRPYMTKTDRLHQGTDAKQHSSNDQSWFTTEPITQRRNSQRPEKATSLEQRNNVRRESIFARLRSLGQAKVLDKWLQSDRRADERQIIAEDESAHRRYHRCQIEVHVEDLLRSRSAHGNRWGVSSRHLCDGLANACSMGRV
jgi:hypothetical protein